MPRGRKIAILTRDFAMYHDLVRHLKEKDVAFASLAWGDEIPPDVGAVISTRKEATKIPFANVAEFRTPSQALAEARALVEGGRTCESLVVGIDPGERPGVVVAVDGRERRAFQVGSPEAAVAEVARCAATWKPRQTAVVRIGHGAPTARDRIVNGVVGLDLAVEIVDETATSPTMPRAGEARDVAAARAIAQSAGEEVRARRPVRPAEGEIRDIQRKSRIASGGDLTISRSLAMRVARGQLTLEEAVERQRQE
ncbi:MAG TPA: hypothetical protein VM681_04235 [Candidatus Thermoplasmatota archaeon]|nr:hypothetical protein [Candidatus Thermoplasmatota archaeon]